MIFNLDTEMIVDTITSTLEDVGMNASEDQFLGITDAIDGAMPGILQLITQSTLEFWRSEASDSSTGWGKKYADAIKAIQTGNQFEVYLDENMIDKNSNKPNLLFAEMVEKGVKSWSIKDALLASEKAKTGKDGVKYISVPFPVRTPRSNKKTKMRSQFGGREMTREMHKILKAGGKIRGTLNVKGKQVDVSGLTRYNTRQLHSQYGIFRTVSEKSKGWQHPGRPAEPVFPRVQKEINRIIQKTLSDFCMMVVRENMNF